jgi:YD repeat-containing protein
VPESWLNISNTQIRCSGPVGCRAPSFAIWSHLAAVLAATYTAHQMQADGDGSYSYQNWTYDVRGEMVKYVDGNGTTTYTYDDSGNRVKEVHGSTTTTYLIDSNNPQGYAQTIEENTNGATNPAATYFVGLTGTQGQTSGSTVIYMLRDNRGYAVAVINYIGAFSGKVGSLPRSTASCFRAAISRRACTAKRRAESSVFILRSARFSANN